VPHQLLLHPNGAPVASSHDRYMWRNGHHPRPGRGSVPAPSCSPAFFRFCPHQIPNQPNTSGMAPGSILQDGCSPAGSDSWGRPSWLGKTSSGFRGSGLPGEKDSGEIRIKRRSSSNAPFLRLTAAVYRPSTRESQGDRSHIRPMQRQNFTRPQRGIAPQRPSWIGFWRSASSRKYCSTIEIRGFLGVC
jgi:hypothetical protein